MLLKDDFSQSDEMLVIKLRDGCSDAFKTIFNRYWDKLYYAAYNILLDSNLSQDIVQDVFIDLWERKSAVEVRSLKAYLFQAIRFQAAKHLKNERFTSIHENVLQSAALVSYTEEYVNHNQLMDTLEKSLAELPPRCRDVFRMSRLDNLSNAEISDRLDISIRTVETHISHALKHLRFAFNK